MLHGVGKQLTEEEQEKTSPMGKSSHDGSLRGFLCSPVRQLVSTTGRAGHWAQQNNGLIQYPAIPLFLCSIVLHQGWAKGTFYK